MNKIFQIFLIIVICYNLNSQNSPFNQLKNLSEIELRPPSRIDFKDTVIFNIAKAIKNGAFIDIPVSINTDDDIVALDFALKFNEQKLKYISIVNHTGYINQNAFWNPNDLKLRCSSYSLNRYDKDTVRLLSIRFEVLNTELIKCSDISMIEIWLNGDPCSFKLICPDGSVPVSNNNLQGDDLISVYPNPANQHIHIKTQEYGMIEIFDLHSKTCYYRTAIEANQVHEINIQNLINGVYIIKMFNQYQFFTKKLIVKH